MTVLLATEPINERRPRTSPNAPLNQDIRAALQKTNWQLADSISFRKSHMHLRYVQGRATMTVTNDEALPGRFTLRLFTDEDPPRSIFLRSNPSRPRRFEIGITGSKSGNLSLGLNVGVREAVNRLLGA